MKLANISSGLQSGSASIPCSREGIHFKAYSSCTLHIAHCTLHIAHFTLYTTTEHCTQRTVYYTLHTAQLQSTLQVCCAVVDNWPSSSTPGPRYLTRLYLVLHNRITQRCNRQFCDCDCTHNSLSLSPILGYVGNRRIIRTVPAMPLQGKVIVYIVCNIGVYGSHHNPIQHCAAVLPVCKYDPAGLGAGTMTVKTTSQGVLQCQIWSLSGGLWPGDGSSKKVRGDPLLV